MAGRVRAGGLVIPVDVGSDVAIEVAAVPLVDGALVVGGHPYSPGCFPAAALACPGRVCGVADVVDGVAAGGRQGLADIPVMDGVAGTEDLPVEGVPPGVVVGPPLGDLDGLDRGALRGDD